MPLPLIGAGMGAAIGGIGGALVGAAGSLFSGKQSADFAERSYKHRYQWQVKDMQKAGLNPMLSFSQGAPNVPQPNFPNAGEGAVKGFSAAQQARLLGEQIQLTRAQTNGVMAENAVKELEADVAVAMRTPENISELARIRMESPKVALDNAIQTGKNLVADLDLKRQGLTNAQLDEKLKQMDLTQKTQLFAFVLRLEKAKAEMMEAGLPEAKAWAAVWEKAGPGLAISREAKGWIQLIAERFSLFKIGGSTAPADPHQQPRGMSGFPYIN